MRPTYSRLMHVTLVSAALVLALAASPTFALGGRPLTIRAVTTRGNTVAITVANPSAHTRDGGICVQLVTTAGPMTVNVPVTAAAGRDVTIRVTAPATVLDVLPLGVVVDDGVPF